MHILGGFIHKEVEGGAKNPKKSGDIHRFRRGGVGKKGLRKLGWAATFVACKSVVSNILN